MWRSGVKPRCSPPKKPGSFSTASTCAATRACATGRSSGCGLHLRPDRGCHRDEGRGRVCPEPAAVGEPTREGRQGRRPTLLAHPRSLPARLPGRDRLDERPAGTVVSHPWPGHGVTDPHVSAASERLRNDPAAGVGGGHPHGGKKAKAHGFIPVPLDASKLPTTVLLRARRASPLPPDLSLRLQGSQRKWPFPLLFPTRQCCACILALSSSVLQARPEPPFEAVPCLSFLLLRLLL